MVSSCPPLLALPIEILHQILELVSNPRIRDVWRSDNVDTSMILPISSVCRQLREIVLSYPALWNSISIGVKPWTRGLAENATVRSRGRFLNADLRLYESHAETDPSWQALNALWPEVSTRLQYLRLVLDYNTKMYTVPSSWDAVFHCSYPALESLSFFDNTMNLMPVPFPPLAEGLSSNLHHLALQSVKSLPQCELPRLTHLALGHLQTCDRDLVELLVRCPKLESLFLRRIKLRAARGQKDSRPYPDLSLPHLRRVVLRELQDAFPSVYMHLRAVLKHPHGYSLQLLGISPHRLHCDAGVLLLENSVAPVKTIRIGMEPARMELTQQVILYHLSVAFLGERSLIRVRFSVRLKDEQMAEVSHWLEYTLRDKSALQSVSDLWIVDFPEEYGWWDALQDTLRETIAALPALEAVFIAVNYSGLSKQLDLGVLPDGREPTFNSPHDLKTVHLVYTYDRHLEYYGILEEGRYEDLLKPKATRQLSLARVLEQLQTGAFDYLDRLVLHAASHFTFDEVELEALRGYVAHVDVEYSDEKLDMPLPDYAREPEASGRLAHWCGVFH